MILHLHYLQIIAQDGFKFCFLFFIFFQSAIGICRVCFYLRSIAFICILLCCIASCWFSRCHIFAPILQVLLSSGVSPRLDKIRVILLDLLKALALCVRHKLSQGYIATNWFRCCGCWCLILALGLVLGAESKPTLSFFLGCGSRSILSRQCFLGAI